MQVKHKACNDRKAEREHEARLNDTLRRNMNSWKVRNLGMPHDYSSSD